jgi:hypothetical protein
MKIQHLSRKHESIPFRGSRLYISGMNKESRLWQNVMKRNARSL